MEFRERLYAVGEATLREMSSWRLWLCSGAAIAASLCFLGACRGENVTGEHELISRQIPIVEASLPNGLQIVMEEDHSSPLVAIRIYVKTGSIYEEEYTGAGISHYFEHLMSGGTTRTRSEAESSIILRELGGMSNAYTTKDHTCFYIDTTSENFGKALELLSDWVMNCALAPAEVERERGVISEEIRMGENEPGRVAMNLLYETAFRTHPERLPVIGYLENFLRITRDDLVAYYEERYVPNNVMLVVAGDVTAQQVFGRAQELFGKFERKPLAPITIPDEPAQVSYRKNQKFMPTNVAYLMAAFHTVPIDSPDVYPLDLMSFILTNGRSSRLYRRMKQEEQLVYVIDSSSFTPGYGAGIFGFYATLAPGNADEAEKVLLEELERLKNDYVSDAELAKAKRQKISDLVGGMETVEGRAQRLGIDMLTTGDPYFSWKYTQRIQEVTKEEIREAAGKYFKGDNLTVVVVGPGEAAAQAAAEGSASEERTGEVRETELDNGMKLLVKSIPRVPLVTIQAHFKGGVRYETPETNGAFNLMTRMMLRGAGDLSSEEIAEEFDAMGASIGTLAGNNSFNVTVMSLSSDFRKALGLLATIITSPTFPEEHFEEERTSLLGRIRQKQDSWESEAFRLFREAMFKQHPYGLDPVGSLEAVEKLSREDIVRVYEERCAPDNMVLAIFGAVSEDAAEEAAREAFGGFVRKAAAPPEIAEEPELTDDVKRVVHDDQTQAVVVLGFRGVRLSDDDRYVLSVIDSVISGIGYPSGRLHDALRVDRDLVYYVHAHNWTGIDPGSFHVMAQTAPEAVDEVVKVIKGELQRIASEPVSERDLELAKQVCVSTFRMSRETSSAQAQEAALYELYGLGYDHEEKYVQRVREVTAEEVLRVASKYFEKPSVLVITRPKPEDGG